jgi:hypothetical protein
MITFNPHIVKYNNAENNVPKKKYLFLRACKSTNGVSIPNCLFTNNKYLKKNTIKILCQLIIILINAINIIATMRTVFHSFLYKSPTNRTFHTIT